MTLEQLRAAFAAAVVAGAAVGATACARDRGRRPEAPAIARHLGESTASPGGDPDRPVARSLDTQEVSATISRPPAGPPPAPGDQAPQAQPTPPAPTQPPPPATTTPITTSPVTTSPVTTSPVTTSPSPTPPPSPPPPPSEPERPGVFSPPPPPPTP